jgi:hypothetical protein
MTAPLSNEQALKLIDNHLKQVSSSRLLFFCVL